MLSLPVTIMAYPRFPSRIVVELLLIIPSGRGNTCPTSRKLWRGEEELHSTMIPTCGSDQDYPETTCNSSRARPLLPHRILLPSETHVFEHWRPTYPLHYTLPIACAPCPQNITIKVRRFVLDCIGGSGSFGMISRPTGCC